MIKKITFLLAFCASTFTSQAQFNFNVNSWNDTLTASYWGAALNGLSVIIGDTSVVKTTGRTGFAAKMRPVDLTAIGLPAYASLFSYGPGGNGAMIAAQFDSVAFYLKQVVGATDLSLNVNMVTTLNNGDTVAMGEIDVDTDVTNFQRFAFKMIPYPGMAGITADSMFLTCLNVGTDPAIKGNTYSIVDDFQVVGVTGSVSLAELTTSTVKVYPTIASTDINFEYGLGEVEKIEVYSMSGQKITEAMVLGNVHTVNVGDFSNGTYLYKTYKQGDVVNAGKFVVRK